MSQSLSRRLICLILSIAMGAVTAPRLHAADAVAEHDAKIVYVKPPDAGAKVRVDGTGRGPEERLPHLFILSPDHLGLTVQEQPSVFCYLSGATQHPMKLTIIQDGVDEPLLERAIDGAKAGIIRVDLAKEKIKLQPDVAYVVNFAILPKPGEGAKDLIASGRIKRIKPPAALLARLISRAEPMDRAIACAKEGVWYDALSILSDEIDIRQPNKPVREQRAALLEQVALAEAAAFDRDSK